MLDDGLTCFTVLKCFVIANSDPTFLIIGTSIPTLGITTLLYSEFNTRPVDWWISHAMHDSNPHMSRPMHNWVCAKIR